MNKRRNNCQELSWSLERSIYINKEAKRVKITDSNITMSRYIVKNAKIKNSKPIFKKRENMSSNIRERI